LRFILRASSCRAGGFLDRMWHGVSAGWICGAYPVPTRAVQCQSARSRNERSTLRQRSMRSVFTCTMRS
jgi:hypothetical protein